MLAADEAPREMPQPGMAAGDKEAISVQSGETRARRHGGSMAQATVALIGFDVWLREVVELILRDEGFPTRALQFGPPALAALADGPPDAILLQADLDGRILEFLDALRVSPATQAIPAIVLGTTEPMRNQAQASGNVVAVLAEPFDVEDLVGTVRAALTGSTFEARVGSLPLERSASRQAADILLASERDIMLAWTQRVRHLAPQVPRAAASVREFLDSVPRLLHALALVLRHDVTPDALTRDPAVSERIRAHVALRKREGVPVEAALQEYQILGDVIGERLQREMADEEAPQALSEIQQQLDLVKRATTREYARLDAEGA